MHGAGDARERRRQGSRGARAEPVSLTHWWRRLRTTAFFERCRRTLVPRLVRAARASADSSDHAARLRRGANRSVEPPCCNFQLELCLRPIQHAAKSDIISFADGVMSENSATKPRMMPIKNLEEGSVGVLKRCYATKNSPTGQSAVDFAAEPRRSTSRQRDQRRKTLVLGGPKFGLAALQAGL